jgi:glycogen synthase
VSRSVSVVVNTFNRAESLLTLLESLTQLDHDNFEVVVVNGPSTDRTEEVLADYAGRIKTGSCAERNLSMSRNIGVALAAGEVVAFIDDDAYPDPHWLDSLDAGFDAADAGAVGGPTFDQTGFHFQARYNVSNRVAQSSWTWHHNPTDLFNHPDTDMFPYTMGTNSSFRREVLVGIGGFDEEYEYYLDETDVCRRMISAGWKVVALDEGFVFHKFLASSMRDDDRVLRDWFPVVKNHLYFGYRHGGSAYPPDAVDVEFEKFADLQRDECERNIRKGRLDAGDRARLEEHINRARVAAKDAIAGERRIRSADWFAARYEPFLRFPTRLAARDRLHVGLVVAEYPPSPVNGIARYVHSLAIGLADLGHVVRVFTRSSAHTTVDLEGGVWVHRVEVTSDHDDAPNALPDVPGSAWSFSVSCLAEAKRVAEWREFDVVQVPNWDSEGVAFIADASFRTVLAVLTPLATAGQINPELFHPGSPDFQRLVAVEQWCYRNADAFLIPSESIRDQVLDGYGVELPRDRTALVPLGIGPAERGDINPPTGETVLFVGRLERRKGIDTLLDAIVYVAPLFPAATFVIAGDYSIPAGPDGRTFREVWESSDAGRDLASRVSFLGRVSDEELDGLYARCDVLVAPSRYESFGLVLLEAMRCGRPVIAGACGGMKTIVVDGVTGRLVTPGDGPELSTAIVEVLADTELRCQWGLAAKARFESSFSRTTMAAGTTAVYNKLCHRQPSDLPRPLPAGAGAEAGATDATPFRLERVLRNPHDGGALDVAPRVVTADGRVKTGDTVSAGRVVGEIHNFTWSFHDEAPVPGSAPNNDVVVRHVAMVGEQRLEVGADPLAPGNGWHRQGAFLASGGPQRSGDLSFRVTATDVIVRFHHHPQSGGALVMVDGTVVADLDLNVPSGSITLPERVVEDSDLREHTIVIRPTGPRSHGSGAEVLVEEVVLLGPLGADFKAMSFDDM